MKTFRFHIIRTILNYCWRDRIIKRWEIVWKRKIAWKEHQDAIFAKAIIIFLKLSGSGNDEHHKHYLHFDIFLDIEIIVLVNRVSLVTTLG